MYVYIYFFTLIKLTVIALCRPGMNFNISNQIIAENVIVQ